MKTIIMFFLLLICVSVNAQPIIYTWDGKTLSKLVGIGMPDSVHRGGVDSVDLFFSNKKVTVSKDDYITHLEYVITAKEKQMRARRTESWGDHYHNDGGAYIIYPTPEAREKVRRMRELRERNRRRTH